MKTIITIAALMLWMSSTAQIEVNETTGSNERIWSSLVRYQSLTRIIEDQDTIFVFTYKNFKYQYLSQYESFMFSGTEELDQFLEVCSEVINEKKTFELQLYGERLRLKKEMRSVRIITSKGWTWFDAKNIKKVKEAIR